MVDYRTKDAPIPTSRYSESARKSLILGKDGVTRATVLNPLPVDAVVTVDSMTIAAEMKSATGNDFYITTSNVGDGTDTITFDSVLGLTLADIQLVENKTQGWIYNTQGATITATTVVIDMSIQEAGAPVPGLTDEFEIVYRGDNRITDKTQMSQISDGTNEVDVIATINSLKSDTSSVAGTATNVNGGNRDAGTQTTTLADDDPAVVSLGLIDAAVAVDESSQLATPSLMNAGGEYRALPTTYTDGDATILQTDINGYLKVAPSGTSKYENVQFDETEDEDEDSTFSTSVIYGYDTDGSANSKLRAVQVAIDNTSITGTPNVLIGGGIYKDALDTYDDNDAVPLHFTASGKLLTDAEVTMNDYVDDSNEFTPATSKMLAIGGIATSDSVDVDDVGAFRMTIARNLGIDVTTKDGSAWAVNNAINVTLGDGTTVPVVETDGSKKALNVNITDGTNDMPTMDAGARAGFVQLSDGTTEADIIATINSLKSDTSSIAGTATNVNGGAIDAGTQTVTLATDDPAVVSLALIDDWTNTAADGASVSGDTAHDAVDAGEPVKVGGKALSAQAVAVASADRTDAIFNLYGEQVVAGHTWATNSNRVEEIDPLDQKYIGETLIDETNITTNTTTYAYIDMAGVRYLGLQAETSGTTPTDVLTVTVEATMQDDGTAPASCEYQDATTTLAGVASWVDTDFFVLVDTPLPVKYLRVKYVTSNDSGSDADLTVYTKKLY